MIYTENYTGQKALFGTDGGGGEGGLDLSCNGLPEIPRPHRELQGVPKRMLLLSGFEFLTYRGVFLGVKNNSKN